MTDRITPFTRLLTRVFLDDPQAVDDGPQAVFPIPNSPQVFFQGMDGRLQPVRLGFRGQRWVPPSDVLRQLWIKYPELVDTPVSKTRIDHKREVGPGNVRATGMGPDKSGFNLPGHG